MTSTPFLAMVGHEVRRAREIHPQRIFNVMEGSGIIREEFEEFWEEVRRKHSERNKKAMLEELVQIAAMCARTAEDCGLVYAPHLESSK